MSTYAFAYIINRAADDDREGLIPRPGGHWLDVYLEGQALPRGASIVGSVDLVRRTWSGRAPWPFTAADMARAAACILGQFDAPPAGACPAGLWSQDGMWLHDATCDCERRTGREPVPILSTRSISDHDAVRDGVVLVHLARRVHERHIGDDGEERCGDVMADDRRRRRLCGGCSHIDAPDSARRGCGEVLGLRDVTPRSGASEERTL